MPSAARRRGALAFAPVVIVICGVLAYANSFSGVLVFDDEPAIAENPYLKHLWPIGEAMAAPDGTTVSGRPVVSLTLAINYALAPAGTRDVFSVPVGATSASLNERLRDNLWGYHALNLIIHLAAALAVLGVLRRTLASDPLRVRFGSSAPGLALAIALLWTMHPLQTAAVTYVVQRAESLMALFTVVTLYCAIRAWQPVVKVSRHSTSAASTPHRAQTARWGPRSAGPALRLGQIQAVFSLRAPGPRGTSPVSVRRGTFTTGCWTGSRWWLVGSVAACALGMGSKETAVVAPLIVVLWDWIFASPGASLRRRLPLYIALAATWIILAVLVAGGHRPNAAGFGLAGWPWWRYLLTQSAVIVHYLRLVVVPWPLVLDYGWPAARIAEVWPQLLVLMGLVIWTLAGVARRTPAGFASGCFFLILAPTSSVLPIVTEVAAEHRMYLPLAAVLAVLVIGGYDALRRWRPALAGRTGAALTAVAALACGGLTYARNADYQDHEGLWRDTIQKRPLNARARNNYATLLLADGRYGEAETQSRVAVEIDPRYTEAQQTLGVSLCAQSRCDEGLVHLEAAGALAPAAPDVQRNLAEAYASRGRMADAVAHYRRALDARPDDVAVLNRAGWILATDADGVRDGARAVVLAEHAVALTARGDAESLDTLAAAYAEVGRFDDAIAIATEALRLAPLRQPAIVPELQQRLASYRARRPFRQGASQSR